MNRSSVKVWLFRYNQSRELKNLANGFGVFSPPIEFANFGTAQIIKFISLLRYYLEIHSYTDFNNIHNSFLQNVKT